MQTTRTSNYVFIDIHRSAVIRYAVVFYSEGTEKNVWTKRRKAKNKLRRMCEREVERQRAN